VTTAVGYLDARSAAYVEDVLDAIDAHVPIVEAYLIGSGAVGDFDPTTSDLDLVVVVGRALGTERDTLVEQVRRIPCPARELELVVYVEGAEPPNFDLNLDGGEDRPDAEQFWFVLDAAVAQDRALPLRHGRPWAELFEPVSYQRIHEAVRESLSWSERQTARTEFVHLNAVRARHYLEHGEWLSKQETES
jgi:predicted nucleotidyltransferase